MQSGPGRGLTHLTPRAVRDYIHTQLWPVPLAAVVVSVVLAQFITWVDRAVDDKLPAAVSGFLFGGGPSAARSLMEAIAGSTITVTSLTFSLTVVTLQLASSQYSPRLLRTFTSDRFVHNTLALFLFTFAFALTVLRTIRDADDQSTGFVPEIAVSLSFLLALATVIGLVLFLGHLSRQLRVERMLQDVREDFLATVDELGANDDDGTSVPTAPAEAHRVRSRTSGFLVEINGPALLQVAQQFNAVITLSRSPGEFLVQGVPFASIWRHGRDSDVWTDEDQDAIQEAMNDTLSIGFERNSVQDIGLALQQLLDVAVRAISPSVNDPTTCIHALGHLSAVLSRLARKEPEPQVFRDDAGRFRVGIPRQGFEAPFDMVVAQICTYGVDDQKVAARLIELLREVSWNDAESRHRPVIVRAAERIERAVGRSQLDSLDQEDLQKQCREIIRANPSHATEHRTKNG